ncbi:MAG: hypothetical protein AAGU21_01140 [Solidesulfovibrio sp.]|uniref:hypothetical protein n=1 Tax=Solidesulfovibrio sp. TaxID=2910990 RepID=UPI002B1F9285|nr:hypothetical protein [Solidesulfovibrio sp.]MEA4857094.1 hypothetical protein [Solidesulfovibrio sp.]
MYEFFQIADSLARASITPPQRAPSLKECPKNKPRLTVYIDAQGNPMDMDVPSRPPMDAPPFLRWSPDNHMAFPTFAVDPLFVTDDKEAMTTFRKLCKENAPDKRDARAQAAATLLETTAPGWTDKLTKKLARQLEGGEILLRETGELPDQAAPFLELVKRSKRIDSVSLGAFLREKAAAGIRAAPLDWAYAIDAIIGVGGTTQANPLLLTLELNDWRRYPTLANSPEVFDCLNACLAASPSQEAETMDAFGLPLAGHQEPMPKLVLPKSGEKPLRSMFGEVPANYRYHRADSASFPVGHEARMRMLSAGKWIMDPEREGKTWAFLTQKTKLGRQDIQPTFVVIAPEDMPPAPPALGQLFAPLSAQAEETAHQKGFAAIAADVAQALRGIWNGDLSMPIHVAVITTFDKGRYKLLMSDTYTAAHCIESARLWQQGCQNIPPMLFEVTVRKKTWTVAPDIPHPSEVIPLFASVWLRGGQECRTTRQVDQDLPARLLLATGPVAQDLAMELLRQHVDDHTPVLLALGVSRNMGQEAVIPAKPPFRIEILPSVLGLLLLKSDRRLEDYMEDAYFLVGQLLSFADTLHEQYCLVVRNKDVPPALLGNTLMRSALENPLEAIDQLTERILVYQGWARSSQKEDSRLAKWVLGQMGSVTDRLHNVGIPEVVTPTGKAELLLGYLASPPKKPAVEQTAQDAGKE